MPKKISFSELPKLFWSRVSYSAPSECWEWTGGLNFEGRGRIMFRERREYAHRVAFALANPSIFDPSLRVLHTCDNPRCVRPSHLFQGTQADNVHDMHRKGRDRKVRGEKQWCAKFTENQVRAIRANPNPMKQIARDYNVSDTAIRNIKLRKTWKHIVD